MTEFRLLLDLNSIHLELIADKVISEMIAFKETFSGDDTCLKNLWEEICVQVQGEESFTWFAYVDALENFISDELQNEPQAVKTLISYIQRIETEEETEAVVYSEKDAVQAIKEKVLLKAGLYTNQNIEAFLNDDYYEDEDEDNEEEEENE